MNNINVTEFQIKQFHRLITQLYQCCQERMNYQSEKFALPDAEFRCLLLFLEEKYLTATGIAQKMNVVKSRVSKIVNALEKKDFIQKLPDPEDSRVQLLCLTAAGKKKLEEINSFLNEIYHEVLGRMTPEQRKAMLANLELLKGSMESVKDLMV